MLLWFCKPSTTTTTTHYRGIKLKYLQKEKKMQTMERKLRTNEYLSILHKPLDMIAGGLVSILLFPNPFTLQQAQTKACMRMVDKQTGHTLKKKEIMQCSRSSVCSDNWNQLQTLPGLRWVWPWVYGTLPTSAECGLLGDFSESSTLDKCANSTQTLLLNLGVITSSPTCILLPSHTTYHAMIITHWCRLTGTSGTFAQGLKSLVPLHAMKWGGALNVITGLTL